MTTGLRPLVRAALGRRYGGRRHLERFYASGYDPFGFDSNPYETAKHDDLLEAVGDRPFRRGLEVGCSVGTLTERLAPVVKELVAIDIAQQAVDRTHARIADRWNVTVERRTFPVELPDGPFDLIVCSDVLYYFPVRTLGRALEKLSRACAPGGSIVSLHWLGEHGAPTTGHGVHDLQEQTWTGLEHSISEHRTDVGPFAAGYRLDRFDKPS